MGLFDSIFGGGGSKSKVPSIDPMEVLNTQAQANRVSQSTPYGSLSYSGPFNNQLNFKLSSGMQRLLNQQTAAGIGATRQGQRVLQNVEPTGAAQTDSIMQRLAPMFEQRENRLRNQLEQSGNPAAFGGNFSEGAFNELALLGQDKNDARLAAIQAGPQYAQSQANIGLGLINGSPVGVPQYNFQGPSPLDVSGAYGLSQNASAYNAQNAQRNRSGMLGGLFDIGSAFLGTNPFGFGK